MKNIKQTIKKIKNKTDDILIQISCCLLIFAFFGFSLSASIGAVKLVLRLLNIM